MMVSNDQFRRIICPKLLCPGSSHYSEWAVWEYAIISNHYHSKAHQLNPSHQIQLPIHRRCLLGTCVCMQSCTVHASNTIKSCKPLYWPVTIVTPPLTLQQASFENWCGPYHSTTVQSLQSPDSRLSKMTHGERDGIIGPQTQVQNVTPSQKRKGERSWWWNPHQA